MYMGREVEKTDGHMTYYYLSFDIKDFGCRSSTSTIWDADHQIVRFWVQTVNFRDFGCRQSKCTEVLGEVEPMKYMETGSGPPPGP